MVQATHFQFNSYAHIDLVLCSSLKPPLRYTFIAESLGSFQTVHSCAVGEKSLAQSKGTASCTCMSTWRTLYGQSEVVGCCYSSYLGLRFADGKRAQEKTLLWKLIPLRGSQSAMLAFTPLLTGNHFSSSLAVTRARDPIFQEGTWTGGCQGYVLCQKPLLSSSTEMRVLITRPIAWMAFVGNTFRTSDRIPE